MRLMEELSHHTRPYTYGTAQVHEQEWTHTIDRRIGRQVREGIMEWVRAELSQRTEHGILAGWDIKNHAPCDTKCAVWGGIVRRVAEGAWAMEMEEAAETERADAEKEEREGEDDNSTEDIRGSHNEKAGEQGEDEGEETREWDENSAARQKKRRVEMTYGMRTGEMEGITHGAHWARCASKDNRHRLDGKRGCPMGCGTLCTLEHVIMGECQACDMGEKDALQNMTEALTGIDEAMVAAWGRQKKEKGQITKERDEARGSTWKAELHAARQATIQATKGKKREGTKGWEALRHILAGVLPEPDGLRKWSEMEAKAKEGTVAEAVGCVQDIAHDILTRWRENSKKKRGEHAQSMEKAAWEEAIERGWRMKKKAKGRAEVPRRTCNWREEDITGIKTTRWATTDTGIKGWDYMISTLTGDIGWVWEAELQEYLSGDAGQGRRDTFQARMTYLQSDVIARMEAKGRMAGPTAPTNSL